MPKRAQLQLTCTEVLVQVLVEVLVEVFQSNCAGFLLALACKLGTWQELR